MTLLTAAETAAAVRAGTTTAVAETRSALARIAALDPALGAFQLVRAERALAEAAAVDTRVAAGEHLPLAGVPIAIKDNIPVAGEPMREGSAATSAEPRPADHEVVARDGREVARLGDHRVLADRGEPALAGGAAAAAVDQRVGAELVEDGARVAAQAEGDRARRLRVGGALGHDLADLGPARRGEPLEVGRELGHEPPRLRGPDARRDQQIELAHSFTVTIGVRAATRVAMPWASSAWITGSIAL